MGLRNDAERYGSVTKLLHWLTVGLVVAQLLVGYSMRGGDDSGHGGGSDGGGHGGDGGGRRGGDDGGSGGDHSGSGGGDDLASGHEGLLSAHVVLGVAILAVTAVRLWWRVSGSLPTWAPQLSASERRLQAGLERCLYALLVVIPLSGLALVFASGED